MKSSLRHASSRKLFLEDGKIVKFYPKLYGYLFHETARIIFQMFNGIYRIDFISRKKRILNELFARKILDYLKIKTTKIKLFSLERYFLEELLEVGYQSLDDVEQKNIILASKNAKTIGIITRILNDGGFYFIDNRSSNWLVKGKKIIRTDLELFKHDNSNRRFYSKCDYISFLSSVESDLVRKKFVEGYGRRLSYLVITDFLVRLYIKLTELIF